MFVGERGLNRAGCCSLLNGVNVVCGVCCFCDTNEEVILPAFTDEYSLLKYLRCEINESV